MTDTDRLNDLLDELRHLCGEVRWNATQIQLANPSAALALVSWAQTIEAIIEKRGNS